MDTETSALLQDRHPSSKIPNRSPLQSSDNHLRPVPFVRSVVCCILITFCGALTFSTTPSITNQYVQSRFLAQYNVNSSTTVCSANASNSDQDANLTLAQEEASSFMILFAVTNNVPAIFMNVILGSSSDFLGRKMLFFVPLFASLLNNIFSICIMYFEMNVNYLYPSSFLDGLGGSFFAFLLACFAYTADLTSTGRYRILAISAIGLCSSLASALGQILTGYLIFLVGYTSVRILMATIVLFGCILVLVLPETTQRRPMKDCSSWTYFKNSFGFYFTNDNRIMYNLVLAIFLCMAIPTLGRAGTETLYALGEPFCFDSIKVGYLSGLRLLLSNMGSMGAIKFLHRCLNYEVIALLASIDSIIGLLLEGLATSGTVLFLVPLVDMISPAATAIARGTISSMTSSWEQGAVFSGIAVVETIVYLLIQVVFNWVYSSTVGAINGAAFFLLAAFSSLGSLLIIVWIWLSPKYRDQVTILLPKEETVSI